MKKLAKKMKFFPLKEMKKVAAKHYALFKKRVTVDGLDKDGVRFPQYSQDYIDLLESDFRDENGNRIEAYRGMSLTTGREKIAKRQFRLRGITMGADFRFGRVKEDSYQLMWQGEGAEIVQINANRKKKRDVINDIPKSEYNKIIAMMSKSIDSQWAKVKDVTIEVG